MGRQARGVGLRIAAAVTVSVVLLASEALALVTPTAVIATAADEFSATSYDAGGLLAWVSNTVAHPRSYSVRLSDDGGITTTKVNAAGTRGWSPSFTGDGTQIYYQEVVPGSGDSNIKVYDVAGAARSDPAGPVNTVRWEYWPSVSGDWLLFGRNDVSRPAVPWQVLLVNMVTDETRILASVSNDCRCVWPGEISGNYATWYKCGKTCNVYLYDIAGAASTKVPNPGLKVQYSPTVTADGTVYFVRSGFACGKNVRIVRYPLAGPETVIVALPDLVDSWSSPGADTTGGVGTNLYIDRVRCRSPYYSDVFKVAGADTAGLPVTGADGSGGRSGQLAGKPMPTPGAHA